MIEEQYEIMENITKDDGCYYTVLFLTKSEYGNIIYDRVLGLSGDGKFPDIHVAHDEINRHKHNRKMKAVELYGRYTEVIEVVPA